MGINWKKQTAGNEKQKMLKAQKKAKKKDEKKVNTKSSSSSSSKAVTSPSVYKAQDTKRTKYYKSTNNNTTRTNRTSREVSNTPKTTKQMQDQKSWGSSQNHEEYMAKEQKKRQTAKNLDKKEVASGRIAVKNSTATNDQKKLLQTTELTNAGNKARKVMSRVDTATGGTLKQIAGGKIKTYTTNSNRAVEYEAVLEDNYLKGKISEEEYKKYLSDFRKSGVGQWGQKAKNDKWNKAVRKANAYGQKLNDEGNAMMEESKKGLGKFGKTAIDAYSSTLGMAADMAEGPLWWVSIGSRSFGNSLNSNRDENGNNQLGMLQDVRQATGRAAVEMGTEAIFSGIGLAKKMVGSKALISTADKIAAAATSKIANNATKNLVYGAVKYASGIAEETLEEVIGWAVDPIVQYALNGNAVEQNATRAGARSYASSLLEQVSQISDATGLDTQSVINNMVSQLNSDEWTESMIQQFVDNGASKKEAKEIATLMKEYLTANLSGDVDAAEEVEGEIVHTLTGGFKANWDTNELLDTIGSTVLMTGVTGIGSVVGQNSYGKSLNNDPNKLASLLKQGGANGTGVDALINNLMNSSEPKIAAKAKATRDYLDKNEGTELANMQIAELAQDFVVETNNKQNLIATAVESTDRELSKEGIAVGNSRSVYESTINAALADADTVSAGSEQFAKTLANISVGNISVDDMNTLSASNIENRKAFNKVVDNRIKADGIENISEATEVPRKYMHLPTVTDRNGNIDEAATNEATQNFIVGLAMDNRIVEAQKETQFYKDVEMGDIDSAIVNRLGRSGQTAYRMQSSAMKASKAIEYRTAQLVFDKVYQAARNGSITFDELNSMNFPVDKSFVESAFRAGLKDNMQKTYRVVGSTLMENPSSNVSINTQYSPKASDIQMASVISDVINRKINLVDSTTIAKSDGAKFSDINGYYDGGEIYLNIDSNMNLAFTFMHEYTHMLKDFAPVMYESYKAEVIKAYMKDHSEEEYADLEKRYIELYRDIYDGSIELDGLEGDEFKAKMQELATDEIVCDISREFLTDKKLVEHISKVNPSLTRTILDSIRDVLSKIRQIIAYLGGDIREDLKLINELEYYKEAELLWLNAAHEAAKIEAKEMIKDASIDVNEIRMQLEESFPEYKTDSVNLEIATEAIKDLRTAKYSLATEPEQIKTLAKGISSEMVHKGYVEFRGRRVNGPDDIAQMCQVLRDPRYETSRIILVRKNKVVSVRSISSKMPGSSAVLESRDTKTGFDIIKDRIKRTKADGFYVVHNHPSGNVEASFEDKYMTVAFIQELGSDMFKGHIILDHDKYGLIEDEPVLTDTPYGEQVMPKASEVQMSQNTIDILKIPELDHTLLGKDTFGPDIVAAYASQLRISDNASVLLYVTSRGDIREIQEVMNNTLVNNKEFKNYIKNQMTESGSHGCFLYTTNEDVYRENLDLIRQRYLIDIVIGENFGDYSKNAREVVDPEPDYEWAGMKVAEGPMYKFSITPKQDADTINSSEMPQEDDVIMWMADHADEIGEADDLTPNERMMMESRARRLHIRDELRAFAEKNYKPTVLTKDKVLDRNSVKCNARELVTALMQHSVYDGKYKTKDVNLAIDGIGRIFPLCKEENWDEVVKIAYDVAAEIIEDIEYVDDAKYTYYKEVRDYFKGETFGVDERTKAEFGDDWNNFRKSLMGKIKLVNDPSAPKIQEVWDDIVDRFGTLVDVEARDDAEMLLEVAHLFDMFSDYRLAYASSEMQEVIWDTATDLIDIAENAEAWHSFADKKKAQYDEKVRKLKQRQAEALQKERIKRDVALAKERQIGYERLKNAIKFYQDKADKLVEAEKQKYERREEKRKKALERAKAYGHIEENYKWLADRLVKPTDDKHIPAGFRSELAHLLQQFDFQTERSKALEIKYGPAQKTLKMAELRRRLEEVERRDDTGIFEYDGYIFEIMTYLERRLDGKPIDELDPIDLNEVDILLKAIRHNIVCINQTFAEDQMATISELVDKTVTRCDEINSRRNGNRHEYSGIVGMADKLLNESEVTPIDMFERIGGGLDDCYKSLRRGFDKHVRNIEYFRSLSSEVFGEYNKHGISRLPFLNLIGRFGSEIEKWRDDTLAQTFTLESGESITLNPAQIMSLYCLSKREQALGHIYGSGIVASSFGSHSRFKEAIGAKRELQTTTAQVTYSDVQKILSTLDDKQKKIADRMQHELNTTFRDWGNETSLRLYGYRKFEEENYFPIQSSAYYLDSSFDERDIVERIRHFGFTKGTQINANNPIVIDDFFDVIVDHVNKMSLYNSFACPIADFQRVYNYKIRDGAGLIVSSVKDKVTGTFGTASNRYINNFMRDLNGSTKIRQEGGKAILSKSFGLYKKAAIGGNLRVGLQQPTAIIRAFAVINPKYFIGGSINVVANMKEMVKYCPIATWKSRGNYQIDMARDLDDIMMNNEENLFDAIFMGGYGLLDNMTWSAIWNAVKNEVKAKNPNMEVGSEEYWNLCNERASEVFDKTQVVDSIFHRSSMMRDQDLMSKLVTSFMAEPTRTFNMVRTDFLLARDMWQNGDVAGAVGKMSRTTTVFLMNAAVVSAAAAVADALRGKGNDDEDKNLQQLWFLNFLENLKDNANLLNSIYIVKDIYGFKDGFGTSNMMFEGWADLIENIEDWKKFATGESKKTAGELIRSFAESLGFVTGVPVKNVLREFESILGLFGIEAMAADGSQEVKTTKTISWIEDGSTLDNVLNRMGLNKTEAEKKEDRINGLVDTIETKTKGLSGSDRDQAAWDAISEGYTKKIEEGDLAYIEEMRTALKKAGVDTTASDIKIKQALSSAYKKTIGVDDKNKQQNKMRKYMIELGMTEAQISNICYQSDTARDLKAALRMWNEEAIIEELTKLRQAGITYDDFVKLYKNRNYGATTYSGKYAAGYGNNSSGKYVWPTQGTVTSGYGARTSPTAGASTYHEAIDIGTTQGSKVVAADGGVVKSSGWNSGYGYQVVIQHDDGSETYYSHLYGYNVLPGDTVSKGQQIGQVGSTGTSTGSHLDFRLKVNGKYVNPLEYLNA